MHFFAGFKHFQTTSINCHSILNMIKYQWFQVNAFSAEMFEVFTMISWLRQLSWPIPDNLETPVDIARCELDNALPGLSVSLNPDPSLGEGYRVDRTGRRQRGENRTKVMRGA